MVIMAGKWSLVFTFSAYFLLSSFAQGTNMPALILVPGAFHKASVYGELASKLRNVGYGHIDMVDLPSVGYDVTDIERTADVDAVIELLEASLNVGEDVILVGNSYGATVIMEAVKDFEHYSSAIRPNTTTSGQILGLIMVRTSIFQFFIDNC